MITTKVFRYNQHRSDFSRLLQFRYSTFVEELHYLPPKQEFQLLRMEFDHYDMYSDHIMIERNGVIIACARIIGNSDLGLPVYDRLCSSIYNELALENTVEVSRLAVKKEYRSSFVYIKLLQTILECLLISGCKYVLADTFVGSDSYKLLLSLGLKEASKEYHDTLFCPETKSIVLYFQMDEMKEKLFNNPNRRQKALLKNYKSPQKGKF